VLWSLGVVLAHTPKFQRRWFGPYRKQYFLLNNIVLLVIIDKFNPNPILVIINKYKPYGFIEDNTLQLILANPSDLVIENFIQKEIFEPLFVENDDSKLVVFELVNNTSIDGNIIGKLPIHNHHLSTYIFIQMTYMFVIIRARYLS
jgi:hypothetical protein